MSTSELVARYERLPLELVRRPAFELGTGVHIQKSVNADRSRLFQALTVPEYIDAWLVAPNALPGSMSVTMGPDCFVVSYNLRNGREERFVGSYKVLRRGKIQFAWRRDSFDETTWSLVRIRLVATLGAPRCTSPTSDWMRSSMPITRCYGRLLWKNWHACSDTARLETGGTLSVARPESAGHFRRGTR